MAQRIPTHDRLQAVEVAPSTTSWVELVGRDPVPWLLDPGNPSARFLTLKHIFRRSGDTLEAEQTRILEWAPIATLRRHWVPVNYWGRAANPFYGGPVGNFGTLFLLAQLGAPRFPELDAVVDSLLQRGQLEGGAIAPADRTAAPWLAYTGIALYVLTHFGYGADERTQQAWSVLTATIKEAPDNLECRSGGRGCMAAAAKVLNAVLHRGGDRPLANDSDVVEILCRYLLKRSLDVLDQDPDRLQPHFPRYYDTDVVELTHLLAHTEHRQDQVCDRLVQRILALRDENGRWIKRRSTPALHLEKMSQPSRWLTFEAVHALMLMYGDSVYAP